MHRWSTIVLAQLVALALAGGLHAQQDPPCPPVPDRPAQGDPPAQDPPADPPAAEPPGERPADPAGKRPEGGGKKPAEVEPLKLELPVKGLTAKNSTDVMARFTKVTAVAESKPDPEAKVVVLRFTSGTTCKISTLIAALKGSGVTVDEEKLELPMTFTFHLKGPMHGAVREQGAGKQSGFRFRPGQDVLNDIGTITGIARAYWDGDRALVIVTSSPVAVRLISPVIQKHGSPKDGSDTIADISFDTTPPREPAAGKQGRGGNKPR